MPNNPLVISTRGGSSTYEVHVGHGLLTEVAEHLGKAFKNGTPRRVAVISNTEIADLYAHGVSKSLEKGGFKTSLWLMKDGERFKSLRSAESALSFLSNSGLNRTDAVLALGGGVVGDLAGFVSSIYLRGIRFVQVPTTLLSMIDSSVGGKTGVNTPFGKNLVGSFHSPSLVLADVATLKTLPEREMTAGLCEAVKQGAISGKRLFSETAGYLTDRETDLSALISEHIAFKASIVRQDQHEDPTRVDPRSRKILNFGHTFGHALEKATDYRYLRHGEAVGYGICFASMLSNLLEILDKNTLDLLNDVVHRTGNLPSLRKVDPERVLSSFQFDKKVITGSLHWILLSGIGKPVIVPGPQIPTAAIKQALSQIFSN